MRLHVQNWCQVVVWKRKEFVIDHSLLYEVKERPSFLCSYLCDLRCVDGLLVVWFESIVSGAKTMYFFLRRRLSWVMMLWNITWVNQKEKYYLWLKYRSVKSGLTWQFCSCLNGTIGIEDINQQYSDCWSLPIKFEYICAHMTIWSNWSYWKRWSPAFSDCRYAYMYII